MRIHTKRLALHAAAPLAAVALGLAPAIAQVVAEPRPPLPAEAGEATEPIDTVEESIRVVRQMKSDPKLRALIDKAAGILILPDYVRAGLVVGARGGEGVLVARQTQGPNKGQWGYPVFYNLGGVSIGAQAGAKAGSIAFLIMDETTLERFKSANVFSLDATAGVTVVDYSAMARASLGKGPEVIAWSDTAGLFAGATIGVSDIMWDSDENRAYYNAPVANPQSILSGELKNPHAKTLQDALK